MKRFVLMMACFVVNIANATQTPAPVQGKSATAQETQSGPTTVNLDQLWDNRFESHEKIIEVLKSANPSDFDTAWKLSRLCYYVGFFINPDSTSKSAKMQTFKSGYSYAEIAQKLEPKKVEGHYWFAVNFGGYGLNKGIFSSLSGASRMKTALDEAVAIDPKYHFGGPHRVRGRLYFKLPGTISFGDNNKAIEDFKKAIEYSKDNKLNRIYYSEILAKTQNKAVALKELNEAKGLPDIVGKAEEAAYKKQIADMEKTFQ